MKNACMKETIVGGKTLKVKFKQDGNLVEMQILEQDEKLRNELLIRRSGEYTIKSIFYPTIGFKTLFIRGLHKACDMEKDSTIFLSEEQATEYIGEISRMIKEINDEAEEEELKTKKSVTAPTPEGYKVNPIYIETKSKRLQLLVQSSLLDKLKGKAKAEGRSVNDLVHSILEEALKGE